MHRLEDSKCDAVVRVSTLPAGDREHLADLLVHDGVGHEAHGVLVLSRFQAMRRWPTVAATDAAVVWRELDKIEALA